jgi:hypothetical protein
MHRRSLIFYNIIEYKSKKEMFSLNPAKGRLPSHIPTARGHSYTSLM